MPWFLDDPTSLDDQNKICRLNVATLTHSKIGAVVRVVAKKHR